MKKSNIRGFLSKGFWVDTRAVLHAANYFLNVVNILLQSKQTFNSVNWLNSNCLIILKQSAKFF